MRLSQLNHPAFWQDLRLLSLFDLTNLEQGLKLHRDSDAELQAAANRLFQNGVITAEDGGYLTPFGAPGPFVDGAGAGSVAELSCSNSSFSRAHRAC